MDFWNLVMSCKIETENQFQNGKIKNILDV